MGSLRTGHYVGAKSLFPLDLIMVEVGMLVPRGPGDPIPRWRPFCPQGQFDGPLIGRHFDDPYLYHGNSHYCRFLLCVFVLPVSFIIFFVFLIIIIISLADVGLP